jgi:hypothetical protein
MTATKFPKDMARVVRSQLLRRGQVPPDLQVLVELFEALYFASLQTEESERIALHVVYVDPAETRSSRSIAGWSYVQLAEPVRATVANFVKIAEASDPRASSFAVYQDSEGRLQIFGLVDQGNSQYDYLTYESDDTHPYPGLFQASIVEAGHIVATAGFEKIAELKAGRLSDQPIDVLSGGPVLERLHAGIDAYIHRIREALREENPGLDYRLKAVRALPWREEWSRLCADTWISVLARLLLRIQNYGHGGAILITPDSSLRWLDVKYKVDYPRLRSSLETLAYAQIQKGDTWAEIGRSYLEHEAGEIPTQLYLDRVISTTEVEQSQHALDGALWFTSLLTRVDGLVLMNPSLEVLGFGVEILCPYEPEAIYLAGDIKASERKLRPISYHHYGTRHRSMMRYCAREPAGLGFVISEDGEVRAIADVNGRLVMWENIKLYREPGHAR